MAVAETLTIQVEVWKCPETGEEILTEEALEQIDRTQARHITHIHSHSRLSVFSTPSMASIPKGKKDS